MPRDKDLDPRFKQVLARVMEENKPLTDGQIEHVLATTNLFDIKAVVRAIEAWHGIRGKE